MNNVLGLYNHNLVSYQRVNKAYNLGEKVVGILHATGTGKTLNALQLALDNKDKKIIYLTPYNSIIEHIKEVIREFPELDIDRDFGHVRFLTYSSLVNMTKDELKSLDMDMLILDEFHHIGAPVWWNRIETILESHPDLLVFGMSAYSIRDRGTAYERDLAEDGGNELFSDKIVSTYDLIDAMIDGVLPVPLYKGAHIHLENMVEKIEKMAVSKINGNIELEEILKKIHDVKMKISTKDSVNDLLIKNIKKNGKYIYFCPVVTKEGINDIYTIMNKTKEFFIRNGYKEEDLCFYVSSSYEDDGGKQSRKCFYNDCDLDGNSVNDKLQIMFAVNQYNEGVHAPNVDGVILGRETKSDIVFFEQIGRALSVRGDTYEKIIEYQQYSTNEIKKKCIERNIVINEEMTKDDMIERLVAPVIIDLVGNYSFIKDLVTELKHRIKLYKEINGNIPRNIDITDNSFDVQFYEQDLFDTLLYIKERLEPKNWDESYNLALSYYKAYGDLNINRNFKTDDGINYEEYGFALGEWIVTQRKKYNKGELSQDKIDKLNNIGMIWSFKRNFAESYKIAKNYYQVNGNLNIPFDYKTDDGYNLGFWLVNQRRKKKMGLLKEDAIKLLEDIDINWSIQKTWEESYNIAVAYYEENNNLNISRNYVTSDGYSLGTWVFEQKKKYRAGRLSANEIELLEKLKINWEIKEVKKNISWEESYELAKKYYYKYGNLNIPRSFKTDNGIDRCEDGYGLGTWISRQRVKRNSGKLSNERIELLDQIKMNWNEEYVVVSWEEAYKLAKKYYDKYQRLNIRTDFKTNDGISYDEKGYGLGAWIYLQRKKYNNNELELAKICLLNNIGMIWNINKNYAYIKALFKDLGINERRYSKYVKHLSYLEFEAKVRFLIANGLNIVDENGVHEIFNMADANVFIKYGISKDELISNYSTVEKRTL